MVTARDRARPKSNDHRMRRSCQREDIARAAYAIRKLRSRAGGTSAAARESHHGHLLEEASERLTAFYHAMPIDQDRDL